MTLGNSWMRGQLTLSGKSRSKKPEVCSIKTGIEAGGNTRRWPVRLHKAVGTNFRMSSLRKHSARVATMVEYPIPVPLDQQTWEYNHRSMSPCSPGLCHLCMECNPRIYLFVSGAFDVKINMFAGPVSTPRVCDASLTRSHRLREGVC